MLAGIRNVYIGRGTNELFSFFPRMTFVLTQTVVPENAAHI